MSITNTFKQSVIGLIPNNWEVKKISDGTTYVDYRGKTPQKTDSGILLLTARNIKVGYIDYNVSNEFISPEDYFIVMNRGLPEIGDVLFTTEAPMGNVAQIDRLNIALAQRVIKFRAKSNIITNDYLKYYFLSEKFQKLLNEKSTGGTAKGIKGSTLHKMILIVPPIPEQQKITAILSAWDAAINNCKVIIEELKVRNKGLSQQLLSGKMRIKGFDKSIWRLLPIKKIATDCSKKNSSDKKLIVLSCTKHNGLVPSLEYFGRKIYSDDLKTYKIVYKGQFAYATNHIEEGSIGYQSNYEEALISPMYTVFQTNENINDNFLFRVLKSNNYIHEYKKRMEGTIDRRGGLRWDEFSKIKVSIPDLKEQLEIVAVLDKASEELYQYQQKLETLQLQKKGLMQQLLTGKIRTV